MKLKLTLAVLAASTLAANAATTVIDTTTTAFSTHDRGNFPLTNTGQTFTTGNLGADTNLSTIQSQEARDYPGTSTGDVLTLEIWTDTDGNHATWDPGVLLGTSTNTVAFDGATNPGRINDFSFSGVTLSDSTVYTIRYLSDDTSGDSQVRLAVNRNGAGTPSGDYDSGTFFAAGAAPFSDQWDSGFSVTTDSVPEPSSALLFGLGGLALILRRRK
jgi:hypothetical protein